MDHAEKEWETETGIPGSREGVLVRYIDELRTWRVATFVVAMLAVAVFCVQRFVTQIFDVAFEICIFHVPAVAVVVYVFIWLGRERKGC